ncbi:winged helix-turn-helix domain-containing protein [Actinoplanes sp. DH11]|uniref:winged helix-turn-helix domain-containing protein n=1 Tax=Actinoplanes sp. DH11 TaxID=2857011 RepID=UPI001E586524|nr:winged helix-turn-helix domain-containing protein [Actinoplanes sp. DH11]
MTDDVRDRILGLLHAGSATVAGLAERLGLPGGVVSFHVKMLEQSGLVRAGNPRVERGVPVVRYVSTAAAAAPPLRAPAPLPGLTWTGTGRFPIPVWTVGGGPAAGRTGGATAAGRTGSATAAGQTGSGSAEATPEAQAGTGTARETAAEPPAEPATGIPAQIPGQFIPGPRLLDVRRIPMDDATFYEYATRLDALSREFAGRATPGAPAAEITIALHRPRTEAGGS